MLRWALVVACVCVVAVHARTQAEVEALFNEFIVDHNKNYDAEEYNKRFQIFKSNVEYIDAFNAKSSDMSLGIAKHADLSHEEYVQNLRPTDTSSSVSAPSPRFPSHMLPVSVDWRNQSVVGPVLDATGCESPYAVVGCVTSFCAITNNKFQFYEPTQVSTCINAYCNASEPAAWKFVNEVGLHVEWNSSSKCGDDYSAGCCIANVLCLGNGNEYMLQTAVGLMGPITVSVDGSHQSFQHYGGGIYYEPACSNSNLTVNLLVVGYGSTNNHEDYWIAQNFWGTTWGINGYILMSRNQNNNCGIATFQCHPQGVHQCRT